MLNKGFSKENLPEFFIPSFLHSSLPLGRMLRWRNFPSVPCSPAFSRGEGSLSLRSDGTKHLQRKGYCIAQIPVCQLYFHVPTGAIHGAANSRPQVNSSLPLFQKLQGFVGRDALDRIAEQQLIRAVCFGELGNALLIIARVDHDDRFIRRHKIRHERVAE